MTAIYPFQRAKGAGYVNNEVPTHTQLNVIDENAAAAADGSLYTDVALVRNWLYRSTTLTDRGFVTVWTGKQWLTVGVTGANTPSASRSYDGLLWTSLGSTGAGDGFLPGPGKLAAASNGSGLVVVGGPPAIASAKKYRVSTDHGATWNVRNSSDATTVGVVGIVWFPAASLFVAQLDNGHIETSPDGTTWTDRSAPSPAASDWWGIAASPTAVVSLVGTSVRRSTNGTTWSSVTIGGQTQAGTLNRLAYIPSIGKFIAGRSNAVTPWPLSASVDDGLTWSGAGLTEVPGGVSLNLAATGRLIVTSGADALIYYSVDGAASWKIANSFAASFLGVGLTQLMLSNQGDGTHFGSLILGS